MPCSTRRRFEYFGGILLSPHWRFEIQEIGSYRRYAFINCKWRWNLFYIVKFLVFVITDLIHGEQIRFYNEFVIYLLHYIIRSSFHTTTFSSFTTKYYAHWYIYVPVFVLVFYMHILQSDTFIQSFISHFLKVEFMDKPLDSGDQRVFTELEPLRRPRPYMNIEANKRV